MSALKWLWTGATASKVTASDPRETPAAVNTNYHDNNTSVSSIINDSRQSSITTSNEDETHEDESPGESSNSSLHSIVKKTAQEEIYEVEEFNNSSQIYFADHDDGRRHCLCIKRIEKRARYFYTF